MQSRRTFLAYLMALIIAVVFSYRVPPAYGTFFGTGVPAGTMVPWWSTDAAVPNGWHLCDGSTVTWQTGPHAGSSVTLPNSLGMYFIGSDVQGGAATANGSGFGHIANQTSYGSTTHSHTYNLNTDAVGNGPINTVAGSSTNATTYAPAAIAVPIIIKL